MHLGLNAIAFKTLLHLGPNVITFRALLHLGPNVITFRTLLHLGPNVITFRTVITFRPSTCVMLLLLDLSAAFDTVDHEMLLKRSTSIFSICGAALNWFRSFLTNRT